MSLEPAPADLRLIGVSRRMTIWFVFYVCALFGVLCFMGGTVVGALFIIGMSEFILSFQRPMPKLDGPASYTDPVSPSWQTPIRVFGLYDAVRNIGGLIWGFVLTSAFFAVFFVLAWPHTLGPANYAVVILFGGYFLSRPLWYPAVKKWLGRSLRGVKKELAQNAPAVSVVADGIDINTPVIIMGQGRSSWHWHVAFSEIDELRMMSALDAQSYFQTMQQFDPTLDARAAWELQQFLVGKLPRPSIYRYTAAGASLLIRGPSLLYVLSYADESGPAAIAAWQAWRSTRAVAQTSSGGNLQG